MWMSWWKLLPCTLLKSQHFFEKIVTAESAVWLTFVPWVDGNSSISFSYSALRWFSRKFVSTDLSDCQPDSSASFSASSTLGPSWVLLLEGHQIYQPWVSPCLFVGTSGGKQTRCLPCPFPSLSSSLLIWYVRVEAVFCAVQWEKETERYASQVLTLVLTATLVWHNFGRQPDCPRDTENKDTLCTHLGALGPVQPS